MELGIDKLRGLADSGYISGGEEQRRKELIEQFFEYQSDLLDCNDDHYYYITHIFSICWRNVFKLFAWVLRHNCTHEMLNCCPQPDFERIGAVELPESSASCA